MTIHAIYENGVFRPLDAVQLPEQAEVEFEPRLVQSSNGGLRDAQAVDGSPISTEDFLSRARRLDAKQNVESALDIIYDSFDELFREGRFDAADRQLASANAREFSSELLVGILTATLPAKSRLPSRAPFFEGVERVLKERNEHRPGLLTGLET